MKKKYSLSLYIFRRDLRLQDNTALHEALNASESVIPCFILDPRQLADNAYKSKYAVHFMLQSLYELHQELERKNAKLFLFSGKAEQIVEQLIHQLPITAIFINRDYTPFSKVRDDKLRRLCRDKNIHFYQFSDALLHEPEEIKKSNGEPYTIFTPFLRKSLTLNVSAPKKNSPDHYYHQPISLQDPQILKKLLLQYSSVPCLKGGRREGLSLLKKIATLHHYQHDRNYPALNSTTHLSAHNKFGTISIREFYAEIVKYFGRSHALMHELYWRDFFTHIVFHFPHVLGSSFKSAYEALHWGNNQDDFARWCQGETGFPIVDAGMRELNQTGYMHNRVRMITASFLIKDLHIDWRWGEKYFAQQLVDYDASINNGNWQWVASTGCDAQPYFRIFNPWLQQQKFDSDCVYIKRWVPELTMLSPKMIHSLEKTPLSIPNYPAPMINHAVESQKTKQLYKSYSLKS